MIKGKQQRWRENEIGSNDETRTAKGAIHGKEMKDMMKSGIAVREDCYWKELQQQ
jgi:hypothetical protein